MKETDAAERMHRNPVAWGVFQWDERENVKKRKAAPAEVGHAILPCWAPWICKPESFPFVVKTVRHPSPVDAGFKQGSVRNATTANR